MTNGCHLFSFMQHTPSNPTALDTIIASSMPRGNEGGAVPKLATGVPLGDQPKRQPLWQLQGLRAGPLRFGFTKLHKLQCHWKWREVRPVGVSECQEMDSLISPLKKNVLQGGAEACNPRAQADKPHIVKQIASC